jgi:hypothetical protein
MHKGGLLKRSAYWSQAKGNLGPGDPPPEVLPQATPPPRPSIPHSLVHKSTATRNRGALADKQDRAPRRAGGRSVGDICEPCPQPAIVWGSLNVD